MHLIETIEFEYWNKQIEEIEEKRTSIKEINLLLYISYYLFFRFKICDLIYLSYFIKKSF